MPTTRSTHLLRRLVGLAAVPALVLTAAACGDDDDSAGDSETFCEKSRQLDETFDNTDDADIDASTAMAAFAELDPPAEIAEEWELMLTMMQAGEDFDPSDTEAIEEFEAASEKVNTFMEEECGLD